MVIVQFKNPANDTIVGVMMAEAKDFKTGSRSFYASGKITLDGKKYQVNCQIVEIGSKPAKEGAGEAEQGSQEPASSTT